VNNFVYYEDVSKNNKIYNNCLKHPYSHVTNIKRSSKRFKKAYGNVLLNKLWETLDRSTINTTLIELI
jgi:hypothetical protein